MERRAVFHWLLGGLALAALAACGPEEDSPENPVPDTGLAEDTSNPVADADPATDAVLVVAPNPIRFGRVAAGSSETIDVTVTNTGEASIEVNNIFVSGSSDYVAASLPWDMPGALGAGEFYTIPISYAPDSDGFDDGVLIVNYRVGLDDALRTVTVPMMANGAEPCIAVTHEGGYDFGTRTIGDTHEEVFTISNCSDAVAGQELVIRGLDWTEAHPWFAISAPAALDERLELETLEAGGTIVIAPQQIANFVVAFEPTNAEAAAATFAIRSNDVANDPLEVEVQGVGGEVGCPVAVARCRRAGDAAYADELTVEPDDTIECDGSGSYGGEIVAYQWTVLERPAGSTSEFSPSGGIADPSLFLDLEGRWILELSVTDREGVTACQVDSVTVDAQGPADEGGLRVELTWTTPGVDADVAQGADLDLHLMRAERGWSYADSDVYYANRNPDWGDPSRTDDDPTLDIDDANGDGPEQISLQSPTDGASYWVGVHYYDDWGHGASLATVRVFAGGELLLETSRELDNGDNTVGEDAWEVARVDWSAEPTVTLLDAVFDIDLP